MEKLKEIAAFFDIDSDVMEVVPLGGGLINDTYKVATVSGAGYVLQRINDSIFRDVDLLQRNIEAVTRHIRAKLEAAHTPDIGRKVLKFISLREGEKTYWTDGTEYWRMSVFIEDSVTIDTVSPEYSYFAGKAFGEFQSMLSDLSEEIGETIPDFHNMELRARQLHEAVEADPAGRCSLEESRQILAEMDLHMEEMCKAERMYRDGLLPKRICHCDTKVSNIQ